MGWTIPTYSGTKATGKPSNYRIAMFELIRAINERRTAQGQALLSIWRAADGTLVSSPSMDDLEDSPAYGHNSVAALNMQNISAQIAAPHFIASGGYGRYYKPDLTTEWTLTALEADVGHEIDTYPTRFNDAGWWQAMQDTLDRMTVVKKSPAMQFTARIDAARGYDTFPFITTKQQSWDKRNDHGNYDNNYLNLGWLMYGDFSTFVTHSYSEVIRHLRVSTTATSSFQGEIVKGELGYGHIQNGYSGSFSATIDGHSVSFSGTGTGVQAISSFEAGVNTSIDLVVTESEPSTVPFTTVSTPGTKTYSTVLYLGTFGGLLGTPNASCWLDMSSVLTDQT